MICCVKGIKPVEVTFDEVRDELHRDIFEKNNELR